MWGPYDAYILIGVVILMLVTLIFLPRWMIMNAMKKVVKTLVKHDAQSPKAAKFAEDMGIRPLSMWDRMFKIRDYRPQAFQLLVQHGIIVQTPEGKCYLDTNKLSQSKLRDVKLI